MFNKIFKKSLQKIEIFSIRQYTTDSKRSILLQDKEKFYEYELRKSPSDRRRVYVWGFAETGALGIHNSLQKTAERHTALIHHPTRLKFAENCDITDVIAGYGFSAFAVNRSDSETLFGTGINTDGQLGQQETGEGENTKKLDIIIYPTAIQLPRKPSETIEDLQVKCMSAGRAHLVVVTQNGTIFTLGNNSFGQCGRQIIPKEAYSASTGIIHRIEKYNIVKDSDEIINVECGQDHTIFLTKSGKLLSCGWGSDGQTGRGNYEPTGQIDYVDGDVSREKIIKVSSASDCVLALNDKGEVFGWGNTEYGQLDNSDNPASQINLSRQLEVTKGCGKIIDIASGGSFCMILNDEGDVFTWGFGALGFGPNIEQSSIPKKIMPSLFGHSEFSKNCRVISITCGIFHMAAINSDGDLFMWGKNKFGHLGLGHTKDQYFPFKTAVNAKILKVSCGVDHNLAICKPFI